VHVTCKRNTGTNVDNDTTCSVDMASRLDPRKIIRSSDKKLDAIECRNLAGQSDPLDKAGI
jgi:hypothetical protein